MFFVCESEIEAQKSFKEIYTNQYSLSENCYQNHFTTFSFPMQTYYTHHNGGRPFKVEVNDKHVKVFSNITGNLVYEQECDQVFVGKSPLCPMTECSGGDGPDFDGNTLLLKPQADENVYLFVSSAIQSFVPQAPIVGYVSPVGNNDVPYPYAIDSRGHYYLLIENVRLGHCDDTEDPYDDYYSRGSITCNPVRHSAYDPPTPFIFHDKAIKTAYYGTRAYTMSYCPHAVENYEFHEQHETELKIGYDDGSEEVLTKETYIELMHTCANQNEFYPLTMTMVVNVEDDFT